MDCCTYCAETCSRQINLTNFLKCYLHRWENRSYLSLSLLSSIWKDKIFFYWYCIDQRKCDTRHLCIWAFRDLNLTLSLAMYHHTHSTTLPQYPRTTVPPYHSTTVPQYHHTTVPPYHSTTVPPYIASESVRLRSLKVHIHKWCVSGIFADWCNVSRKKYYLFKFLTTAAATNMFCSQFNLFGTKKLLVCSRVKNSRHWILKLRQGILTGTERSVQLASTIS